MSIIVKHRTDIDLVAERVGRPARRAAVGKEAAAVSRLAPRRPRAAARSASARSCAARASRSAPPRSSTRSRRSTRCPGPSPPTSARRSRRRSPSRRRTGGSSSCSSTATSSARPRPRRSSATSARSAATRAASGSTSTSCARRSGPAIAEGTDGEMRDAARLAIAAFGRQGEGSGVVGVDVQRIRRTLGLQAGGRDADGEAPALDREQIQAVRAPPAPRARAGADRADREAAALAAAGRARPGAADEPDPGPRRRPPRGRPAQAPAGDARPRAARAPPRRGGRHAADDARLARDRRRAAAAALPTEAPPPARDLRPLRRLDLGHLGERLLPLASCTPSTTRSASCAASSSSSGSPRSPRSSSASATSARSREKISREGGVADVSGYTDYGRVWLEFFEEISDDLDPRSTVIVLGDARTNGREPHAEVFARISERAGRTFWLNPEPRLYWNYGDSVMSAYERHCDARLRVLDDQAPRELRRRDRRRAGSRTRHRRPGETSPMKRRPTPTGRKRSIVHRYPPVAVRRHDASPGAAARRRLQGRKPGVLAGSGLR